jgi:putative SOS response-associated peptidase YedK
MCGRYTLATPGAEVAGAFGLDAVPDLPPRYNIAPTQPVAAVRAGAGGRELVLLRWGLVPSWAGDLSIGQRLLNARAETLTEKPAFRSAFARRRCLVPADGFYEWAAAAGKKQPIHFRLRSGGVFALAGLWERWQPPGGAVVESCSIVTTEANELVRPVHERMPAILDPALFEAWLDPGRDGKGLLDWLRPLPAEKMAAVPVSRYVSNARNEGPACLAPA